MGDCQDDVDAPIPPEIAVIRSKGPHEDRVKQLKVLCRDSDAIVFTGAGIPAVLLSLVGMVIDVYRIRLIDWAGGLANREFR
jgi:hypothetical protein